MKNARNTMKKGKEKHLKVLILTLYSRFMPGFYLLESLLKNRIFAVINEELGESWFQMQLEESTSDGVFKTEISRILQRKQRGYDLTPEKLLAESGLGLWVEFFNPRVYKMAKGRPIKIFLNLPATVKRAVIYQRLTKLKDFRNLLVHSRLPLIGNLSDAHYLDEILEHYKTLDELLFWLGESIVFPLKQIEQEVQEIRSELN